MTSNITNSDKGIRTEDGATSSACGDRLDYGTLNKGSLTTTPDSIRGEWGSQIDFVISCMAPTGLGRLK